MGFQNPSANPNQNSKKIMQLVLSLLLSALFFLGSVANFGNSVYQSIRVSNNVVNPLEIASTLQDPKVQLPYFIRSAKFLEQNNLVEGNTCLFFSTRPDCELSYFYNKIQQDIEILHEIENEPISSLDVTNAEFRIHQSLFKSGESGERIPTPDYSFAMRWGTENKVVTKTFEWFLGIFATLIFVIFVIS